MPEPLENFKQESIAAMAVGERYQCNDYFVCRYKDGWYFFWNTISAPAGGICGDLGRCFLGPVLPLAMREFMDGDWTKGFCIPCPNVYE